MNFENELVAVYFSLIGIARRYYYHDERAHDLAAEAVCKALEARERYDTSRPLLTWCRAIMRNLWVNTEQRLSVTQTQRLGEWDEPGGEEADQVVMVNDVLDLIGRCNSVSVDTLMEFAKGYSIADIASSMHLPEGTVKRRIHDARRKLATLVNVK